MDEKTLNAWIDEQYRDVMKDAPTVNILAPFGNDAALHGLFEKYSVLKEEKNRLEAELDRVDEQIAPVKDQIVESMVAFNYQKISHNGTLFYLSVPARPSIIPEKRAEFIAWLKEHGEDGIVQTDYINHNTLWSWYTNRADPEKEELSGLGVLRISEEILLNSPKDYQRKRKKR